VTLAAFTGTETLTFPDYTDLGTGRTLTAEPGESYDIAPASGRLVPDLPEAWFTPAGPEAWAKRQAAADTAAADSTDDGGDAGSEPGTAGRRPPVPGEQPDPAGSPE
jgi:hypothetical protein